MVDPARSRLRAWLLRTVPFTVVTAGLAGIAYWGHRTEWSLTPRPMLAAPEPPTSRAEAGPPKAVRFTSAAAVEAAGIDVSPVLAGAITESVTAAGELAFDPARVAQISTRAAGVVWRVSKSLGDPVAAGEILAIVDAAEISRAKAELLQAIVHMRLKVQARMNLTAAADATRAQRLREADAALQEAAVRLRAAEQVLANFGLPVRASEFESLAIDSMADRLRRLGLPAETPGDDVPGGLLPLRSPIAGVVTRADRIAGEMLDATSPAFVVTDTSRMRLTLHIPADAVRRIAIGQGVSFQSDGRVDGVAGRVGGLGRTAAEATRTIPVWADLVNVDGRLKAGTLGRGRVILRTEAAALVVPSDAVHALDGQDIVFVRAANFLHADGPKLFFAREIRRGTTDVDIVEIVSGLALGDVVATKGSAMLLNELRKNRPSASTGESR